MYLYLCHSVPLFLGALWCMHVIVAQVLCIVVTFVPCRTRLDHHQSPDVAKLDSSEGSTDWNVLAYHMVAFFNNYDLL